MNKERRARLSDVVSSLRQCVDDINDIDSDEEESRENLPENMHDGDRYQESEEYSDKMNEAVSLIEEAIDAIEEI